MITLTRWIDRKFEFNFPVGLYPCILERLRGTPVRLEQMVGAIPKEVATNSVRDGWSIQEHVGHLIQVEGLHDGRIDDFVEGVETLRAADMSNRRTYDADYNALELAEVLAKFREVRAGFVERLESVDDEVVARVVQHPRLDVPMRLCDMAYFAAEHDDQHVATIRDLMQQLG